MTHEQRVLLHLSLINDVGPSTIHLLVAACARLGVPLTYVVECSIAQLCALGLTMASAQTLKKGLEQAQLIEQELSLVERTGARIIFYTDAEYPDLLKHIAMPPLLLYVRGTLLSSCARTIAIVGSRQATAYGRECIAQIMPSVAAHGWCVVSGGARGIDTMAHEEALTCGVSTVVVLGSGLLVPYPRDNKQLFERVVTHGGAVMSSFGMTVDPEQWHFPARNRIIAGMSLGVVVVQAAQKSGAHITARYALDYGREVFAVPGKFNDALSAGCHELIHQGATLLRSAEDLFEPFEPSVRPISRKTVTEADTAQLAITQPLTVGERIMVCCRTGASIDELMSLLDLPAERVYEELFSLQMAGKVRQDFTGKFCSTSSA
jgi:DNA processing protein